MKPFLKWAGSKYKIVDKIVASLPLRQRLIEPFVGSGAVFLNTDYPEYLLADSNQDLINLYDCVRSNGLDFIEYAKQLFIVDNNNPESFYRLRAEFNSTQDTQRKSAIFIYLNRHCFNGLCRYNNSGKFNVPFGKYRNPSFPEQALIDFHAKSQSATFLCSNFLDTMRSAKIGDVVYCDPPYAPIDQSSNFTSYTKGDFNLDNQQELSDLALELMNKGIPTIISNHDTEFTRSIYAAAQLDYFNVRRFISSNASTRGNAPELLATFSS